MAKRLEPWEAWTIWCQIKGTERDRVLGFADALANHFQGLKWNEPRTPLKWLDLPTYQYNALRRSGYEYIEDVERLTRKQLGIVPHVGIRGVRIIERALEQFRSNTKESA